MNNSRKLPRRKTWRNWNILKYFLLDKISRQQLLQMFAFFFIMASTGKPFTKLTHISFSVVFFFIFLLISIGTSRPSEAAPSSVIVTGNKLCASSAASLLNVLDSVYHLREDFCTTEEEYAKVRFLQKLQLVVISYFLFSKSDPLPS